MTTLTQSNQAAQMNTAAERYIAFDKSDPFTRNRIYSHIANGIATPMRASRAKNERWNRDDHGKTIVPRDGEADAFYDCEQYAEYHSFTNGNSDVVNYTVPAYKNMIRP